MTIKEIIKRIEYLTYSKCHIMNDRLNTYKFISRENQSNYFEIWRGIGNEYVLEQKSFNLTTNEIDLCLNLMRYLEMEDLKRKN